MPCTQQTQQLHQIQQPRNPPRVLALIAPLTTSITAFRLWARRGATPHSPTVVNRATSSAPPCAHPVLAGAGRDFIGGSHAQLRPRLFGQRLDRCPPVPKDISDGFRGHVHRRRLRLVLGCNAADDLAFSSGSRMKWKKGGHTSRTTLKSTI